MVSGRTTKISLINKYPKWLSKFLSFKNGLWIFFKCDFRILIKFLLRVNFPSLRDEWFLASLEIKNYTGLYLEYWMDFNSLGFLSSTDCSKTFNLIS